MAIQDVVALCLIAMLKADHADVRQLFEQFEKSEDTRQRTRIAQQICEALARHAAAEPVTEWADGWRSAVTPRRNSFEMN